eukprot:2474655-Pyramimonas_sp.AAC.1
MAEENSSLKRALVRAQKEKEVADAALARRKQHSAAAANTPRPVLFSSPMKGLSPFSSPVKLMRA